MSEADIGGMAVELEPSCQNRITSHCREAEGQSDKMVSDLEVLRKQRRITEFLRVEKIAPVDIH